MDGEVFVILSRLTFASLLSIALLGAWGLALAQGGSTSGGSATPILTPEEMLGRPKQERQKPSESPNTATQKSQTSNSEDLLSQYDNQGGLRQKWNHWLGKIGLGGTSVRKGNEAYQAGDYDGALQKYAEGLLDSPENQLLQYNAGNAHFRKRKFEDAIQSYRKALLGDNASISAKSWYNLGNAYFRKGEFALQQGKQEGLSDYREALAAYKKSLEIRPENKDAKRNIEVVQARIKELLERQKQDQQQQQQNGPQKPPPEPSAHAKQVLAKALQLTAQRQYAEAKALLEDLLVQDATAESYKSYVQRLDDVLKILRGETPSAPAAQDPRAQQPGMGVI
jgi:tetratricopeptide (TPR) repeat protein